MTNETLEMYSRELNAINEIFDKIDKLESIKNENARKGSNVSSLNPFYQFDRWDLVRKVKTSFNKSELYRIKDMIMPSVYDHYIYDERKDSIMNQDYNQENIKNILQKVMSDSNDEKDRTNKINFSESGYRSSKFFKNSVKFSNQINSDPYIYERLNSQSFYSFVTWLNIITKEINVDINMNELKEQFMNIDNESKVFETETIIMKVFKNGTVELKFKKKEDLEKLRGYAQNVNNQNTVAM